MGRLIDADAFERSVMFSDTEDMQDIIYALRDYPTAYDPDNVVEQLKKKRAGALSMLRKNKGTALEYVSKCRYDIWNETIEIVKGGGIDGN